jgi:hypothetical protein
MPASSPLAARRRGNDVKNGRLERKVAMIVRTLDAPSVLGPLPESPLQKNSSQHERGRRLQMSYAETPVGPMKTCCALGWCDDQRRMTAAEFLRPSV